MTNETPHRSGYVAVVGRPNVGKSTLVNALVGRKVAIVSPKPQTTRRRILGVLSRPDAQILFLDTPGIHQPREALNRFMMREAEAALGDCDAILFVVDVSEALGPADKHVMARITESRQPKFLALNKADRLDPRYVVEHVRQYQELFGGEVSTMLTSGTRGDNLDKLLDMMVAVLPEGPEYYPSDQHTDQTQHIMAAEYIREQALIHLNEEVPHAVACVVDEWEPRKKGGLYVVATIYVERDSQKGILIGKGGAMLKKIGAGARKSIEEDTGSRVFLELWVKVRDSWRHDETWVDRLVGLDS
ncbi:MAG: GTPase Era [Thermoflexales bacterium]